MPGGYLVVGDAACAPCPAYGHGITMAAEAAATLDRLLGPTANQAAVFEAGFGQARAHMTADAISSHFYPAPQTSCVRSCLSASCRLPIFLPACRPHGQSYRLPMA